MRMDNGELCMALMRADTEAEVVATLRDAGYWDDPDLWRPVGDNDNNFATIGNQQSEAIAALVEKVVNGVDARLIAECLAAGIDPTSPGAPQTIREAVARFFEGKETAGDADGRIADWTDTQATAEGRLLTISATGHMPKNGKPSISVADAGEGQTPGAFPDTFMSLGKTNKLRIPFVQGKFNMGGTGALQFCGGEHKVQLIVSRRNPALLDGSATARDGEWGFTVVRRQPPEPGARSSVFTYLAPAGAAPGKRGGVLSFPADEWPIFPQADADARDAYRRVSTHGSLVKMYEYDWQGTKSNIVSTGDGLLRRIDVGLPELALPVRLFECRPGYQGHSGSFATNALGLVARLDRDRGANLEPESPIGGVLALEGKQIRTRAYVFQPDSAKNYRSARHGVVFTVNGQMHGAFSVDFFRRKKVRKAYLADSLLVVVDCTAIDGQMREDLFMNSRDRLRDTPLSRSLEAALEQFLCHEPTLRELQNRRRQAEIDEKLSDDQPLADVLRDLIRSNPSLARLFLMGSRVPSPFPPGSAGAGAGEADTFEGKRFPNYFRFKGKSEGEDLLRDAHLGSRIRVAFETDAEDEYFVRDHEPGAWNVRRDTGAGLVDAAEWTTTGPKSGVAQLWIDSLPADATPGDVVTYLIEVTDPARVDAFVNRLELTVKPGPPPGGGGGNGGSRSRNSGSRGRGGGSGVAIPEVIPVHESEWASRGMDQDSALAVVMVDNEDGPESYDFFINVDNRSLKSAQAERHADPQLLEKQFTYGLVVVGLAMLQETGTRAEHAGEDDAPGAAGGSVEGSVATVTRALAPVFLPLVEMISGLRLDEDHG